MPRSNFGLAHSFHCVAAAPCTFLAAPAHTEDIAANPCTEAAARSLLPEAAAPVAMPLGEKKHLATCARTVTRFMVADAALATL